MTPGSRAARLIKDGAIALSLANLWFLAVWADLLPSSPNYYFLPAAPSPPTLFGVVIAVLTTAGAVLACVTLARRSKGWSRLEPAIRLTMLLLLLHVANLMRREVPGLSVDRLLAGGGLYLGAAVGVALIAGFALYRRGQLLRAVSIVPILLLPFAAYTLGTATLSAVSYSPESARFATPAFARPKPPQAGPRVVWHMFDAMDERMTFVERPSSVRLPELDRLRGMAVVGTNTYTASISTMVSVPSMITGAAMIRNEPASVNESILTYRDSGRVAPWSGEPNVFARAQEAGFNTAVAGYSLPYCRIFAPALTQCLHTAYFESQRVSAPDRSLVEGLSAAFVSSITSLPKFLPRDGLHPYGQRQERLYFIEQFESNRKAAARLVADPALGLVMIHWLIPHPPGFYDRAAGAFSAEPSAGYLDNLVLVDRSLAEMRGLMETAGTWDGTAVLVTGDHSWRESADYDGKIDRRVPFLLKMPGQTTPVVFDRAFENVMIGNLLPAILRQEVTDAHDVVRWLEAHAPAPPGR